MPVAPDVDACPATPISPLPPGGPLAGVRVVEIGRYIAAPYAGRLLAGLGAEVVKVEASDGGDPMRRWEGGSRPYSPQFAAYNRGKASVTLDLGTSSDAEALRSLARGADVLLENFRPGVMARLGLDPVDLLVENPRLICCSITGFGAKGPYAERPSYDTVISAVSGLYSLMMPMASPAPVGPAMSDLLSGLFAVQGILAALHHRDITGRGQIVDVTMLGSVLDFIGEAVTSTAETGHLIEPNTRQRRAQAYGATAADGRAFVVHLSVPDKFWRALCSAMNRPDWLDDARLATRADRYENYQVLDALIREQALTRTRAEWFGQFVTHDLPHAPVNNLLELSSDEQVRAMAAIVDQPMPEGPPMSVAAYPVQFSDSPNGPLDPAPALGAHTADFSWSPLTGSDGGSFVDGQAGTW